MENLAKQVSVITICYNSCADLERTILSVKAQTYDDIEYIVVDGGSTDSTPETMERYAQLIDIAVSEPDNGIYDAINKGIRRAGGEWILCLNAGDTFATDHVLEDIFSKEIPHGKSILYSDFFLCWNNGKKTLRQTDRSKGEIHHQNVIYRKALHEQLGYYVVTRPYIVSDLLFFLSIPEEQYLKIDAPIADVKAGGISNGQWCTEQAWAAKVIYGIDSIPGIFAKYAKAHASIFCRRLAGRVRAFFKGKSWHNGTSLAAPGER